jgi:thioredoxin 1
MATATSPAPCTVSSSTAVMAISDNDFTNLVLLPTSGTCLVAFGASWCGPCKQLKPNLETIVKEFSGRVNVYYYDVDKSHTYAETHSVRGVPTLLLFVDGRMIAGLNGYQAVSRIEQLLKPYLPATAS